jgi:hypothetical protein
MTQVTVNTTHDVICPSHYKGGTKRCTRGVGHEGSCVNGRISWRMTSTERLQSNLVIARIVQDQKRRQFRIH